MFWLQRLNPANEFKEYFELAHAVSPALKDEVFRLRHRVFCDELGFEQAMFDGRERDEFDDQSRHLLLRSVKTGQCVGCVRLVMAHPDRPALPLPFEKLYAAVDGLGEQNPARLARASIAEISRLTLAREFRRKRRGDGKAEIAKDKPVGAAHPTYPYMHLGLYLGAIALAEQLGICKLFLLTEPRLLVHFRRLGLPVHQIGPPIEHRGLREASLTGGAMFAAFSIFWSVLTLLLAGEPFHMGPQAAGLFGIVGAAGALAAPLAGKSADKRGPRAVISLSIALVAVSFVIFALSGRSIAGLVIGVIVLDIGVQAAQISNQSRIYALKPDARSRVNTVYMVAYFIGGAVGSAVASFAWHALGWTGVCLAGLAATGLAGFSHWRGRVEIASQAE